MTLIYAFTQNVVHFIDVYLTLIMKSWVRGEIKGRWGSQNLERPEKIKGGIPFLLGLPHVYLSVRVGLLLSDNLGIKAIAGQLHQFGVVASVLSAITWAKHSRPFRVAGAYLPSVISLSFFLWGGGGRGGYRIQLHLLTGWHPMTCQH